MSGGGATRAPLTLALFLRTPQVLQARVLASIYLIQGRVRSSSPLKGYPSIASYRFEY